MAFFNEIGKKISQTGQSAVQKTKEMADVAKLNSMISDEEKLLENNYIQIGKQYVSLHTTDYEDAFANSIRAVIESEEKINKYRQQINDIKGVRKCESCGAEVSSNADFCSTCGKAMPKIQPKIDENSVICSNCGNATMRGMRFCTYCGSELVSDDEQTEDAIVATVIEKTSQCPNCGKELSVDAAFCSECGTKI